MNKPVIVLSGINLYLGGTLRILQECISEASRLLGERYHIVALVHDKALFQDDPNVEFRAYPRSRRSWLFRLYYEYIAFGSLSRKLRPALWLSLHDTTPNVEAGVRAVYCHHIAPFYEGKLGIREAWEDPAFFLFCRFYHHLYRINLEKNDHVIVQQEWLRRAFREKFGARNVVVARPAGQGNTEMLHEEIPSKENREKPYTFFYPSVARTYKNFELVAEAARQLQDAGVHGFRVVITLRGDENRYARRLLKEYGEVSAVEFRGYLTQEEMQQAYRESDCLVFPSHIETWGLPVSEAMSFGKRLLVAERPYARETVGDYSRVNFFDPNDSVALTQLMHDCLEGKEDYDKTKATASVAPTTQSWEELFQLLLPDTAGEETPEPLVSIVTPNYNGGRYIAQCIESVQAQTYTNWEMIVVDDCSTDDSREIIARYAAQDSRIRPIPAETNQGVAGSRNSAIRAARGQWIAFLDSDDCWDSTKLARQVEFARRNPSADIVFSHYRLVDEEGRTLKQEVVAPAVCLYRDLLKSNHIGCLTAMYNKEKIGARYFEASGHEDYILWLSILKEGYRACNEGSVLASHRLHGASLSADKRSAARWQWDIYRKQEQLGRLSAAYYFLFYAWNGWKKRMGLTGKGGES